jgi:hypothetical protein
MAVPSHHRGTRVTAKRELLEHAARSYVAAMRSPVSTADARTFALAELAEAAKGFVDAEASKR